MNYEMELVDAVLDMLIQAGVPPEEVRFSYGSHSELELSVFCSVRAPDGVKGFLPARQAVAVIYNRVVNELTGVGCLVTGDSLQFSADSALGGVDLRLILPKSSGEEIRTLAAIQKAGAA